MLLQKLQNQEGIVEHKGNYCKITEALVISQRRVSPGPNVWGTDPNFIHIIIKEAATLKFILIGV